MDNDEQQYKVEDLMGGGGQCDDAIRTLYSFLDGELTLERRQAIQRHLDECSPCLQAFDWEAELKIVVARCCKDQVPDSLRQRIADVIHQASQTEPGPV